MRGKLHPLGLALILGALILSGCGSDEEAEQPGAGETLVGTEWVLTSLNGESLIEGTEINLYFEEAFLGGSMTCNGYGGGPDSGKYVTTDDGTLTLPQPIAVTVQLCSEPKGIMEQEATYIGALRRAASYRVVDDRLEIDNAAGEMTLVFARRGIAGSSRQLLIWLPSATKAMVMKKDIDASGKRVCSSVVDHSQIEGANDRDRFQEEHRHS